MRKLHPRAVAWLTAVPLAVMGAVTAAAVPAVAATVVVMGPGAAGAVTAAGGTVLRSLPVVDGVAAQLPAGAVVPGHAVVPNSPLHVAGASTGGASTASTVRQTLGLTDRSPNGTGATVAVVDTGVADVPELAGRLTHVDVTGEGAGDGYGHGTFVAGLVAGTGVGVAPGAQVVDVKVGHADGSTSLVEVLAGLQAVADNPNVDVVNLSLSSGSQLDPADDPLAIALDALRASGMVVVVPAGNEGPAAGTVTSPGTDTALLTVGGLDENGTAARKDDSLASWSGRGGAGLPDPDLVAPGAHLVSLGLPGSVVWNENPSARRDGNRFVGSGTSFSAAVVSGAAAVLLGSRPDLTAGQVDDLLHATAYTVRGASSGTGAGGVDLAAALGAPLPAAAKGDLRSPHRRGEGTEFDANAWAARQWAARQWAARQWAARQWAARQWAARQWSARQWSADSWEARQWSARQWTARQWSDTGWE